MKRHSVQDDLVLLSIMVFWGFNFIAAKLALREIDTLAYVAARNLGTLVILVGIFLAFTRTIAIRRADLPRLIAIGVVGITLNQLAFNTGVKLTSAANASLIMSTSSIFGLVFGVILERERVKRRRWLGVFAALAGVGLVIAGRQGEFRFGLESLQGDLLMLGGAATFALYATLGRPILKRYSPLQITTYGTMFGVPLLMPFTMGNAVAQPWGSVSALAWSMALYITVFGVITAVLWYRSVGKVGASRSLVFMYLVPVFATLFGAVFLQESLSLMQVVGAVVVLGGVYAAQQA